VGLAVPHVARLAFGTDHRQARNGRGLASCRLSPVLDLEGAAPLGPTNFGIFDAFADESGRQAHLNLRRYSELTRACSPNLIHPKARHFLLLDSFRTVLAVKVRFARASGAPLTAPGRSKQEPCS
jgi:hypothetical protein